LTANSWHVATCSDEAQLKRRIVLAVQRALPVRRVLQVPPHRVEMNDNHKLEMLPERFGLKSLVDLHIGNNSIQQGGLPSDFGGHMGGNI
jgi:hypothetical protein